MIPRASNSTADLVSSNTILFETCQRQTGDRHLTRGVPNSSALMRESHHIVRRYTPAQLPDPVFNNVSSADTDTKILDYQLLPSYHRLRGIAKTLCLTKKNPRSQRPTSVIRSGNWPRASSRSPPRPFP